MVRCSLRSPAALDVAVRPHVVRRRPHRWRRLGARDLGEDRTSWPDPASVASARAAAPAARPRRPSRRRPRPPPRHRPPWRPRPAGWSNAWHARRSRSVARPAVRTSSRAGRARRDRRVPSHPRFAADPPFLPSYARTAPGGAPGDEISQRYGGPFLPGVLPARTSASRSTYSICALSERRSSAAHFWRASRTDGSMRSRNDLRSGHGGLSRSCRH